MKYIILVLSLISFIFIGIGTTANLYNLQDAEISKTLETINATYHINTDIHILDQGDTCADRLDFSACVRETYDDAVDLIFIINNAARKVETSINQSISHVIPRVETLNFEQSVVASLQAGDTNQAINEYLQSMIRFIKNECEYYQSGECTLEALTTAKILHNEALAEDRARKTVKYLWTVVALLLAGICILGGWSRWKTKQRNSKNTTHLNQLMNHTKFLAMTVEHDTHLQDEDKNTLQQKISTFEENLESLASSSPDRLHLKLTGEKYEVGLQALTDEYQNMLELLGNSQEILAQVHKIKGMDI